MVSYTSHSLYPRERAPDTHRIGGLVGPRADLDAIVRKKKISQELNPVPQLFTL
jgi:hypothetical protein